MRQRRRPIAQMNVVPYIDVMLVLLVIFMVTAPLVQTTTINLPASSQPQAQGKVPDLYVEWQGKNAFSWRKGNENVLITVQGESALVKALKAALPAPSAATASQSSKPVLVFLADEQSRYGEVMDKVDFLREHLPEVQLQLLLKKR
jgi:biopolymer transport protein TolR